MDMGKSKNNVGLTSRSITECFLKLFHQTDFAHCFNQVDTEKDLCVRPHVDKRCPEVDR